MGVRWNSRSVPLVAFGGSSYGATTKAGETPFAARLAFLGVLSARWRVFSVPQF